MKGLKVQRVIDVSSGNGKLCSLMRNEGYYVVGVEYDKNGVELSRSKYPEIKFYNYGVQDDPSAILAHEEKFDVVVSTEVVEHLFSPHLLPIFAKRLLNNGGVLVITTPYHGYIKNLILSIFDKWDTHHTALWHGGHIKFWSRKSLTKLLEKNGFKVIDFSGVGRIPFLWKSMVVVAKSI
ncbi:MAG: class I SAM-dependent methyltransferase [Candidatus Marithrix sp.]